MTSIVESLRQRIRDEGPISFAVFMEETLYSQGGYYNREELAIGERGDFVTGSSLTPRFGELTARLLDRLDRALGAEAAFLEAGYGAGEHLRAVSEASLGSGRRLIGWDRVRRELPPGVEVLDCPDSLGRKLEGLVFSYELFDALPVHRLIGRADGSVGELCVALSADESFCWQEVELSDPQLADLLAGGALEPGQIADLSPEWEPLYRWLASSLERGLLITCDYGYERPALLDPRIRRHGTLACYRSHRVHRNALAAPGEQDLTSHIDFTTLREAGESLGFRTIALTRQARWLTALGIFDGVESAAPADRHEVAMLLDPEGMGEEIRVLIQAKGVEVDSLFDLELLGGHSA
jgi:SAM-dependent MidA family methyltransferase